MTNKTFRFTALLQSGLAQIVKINFIFAFNL